MDSQKFIATMLLAGLHKRPQALPDDYVFARYRNPMEPYNMRIIWTYGNKSTLVRCDFDKVHAYNWAVDRVMSLEEAADFVIDFCTKYPLGYGEQK